MGFRPHIPEHMAAIIAAELIISATELSAHINENQYSRQAQTDNSYAAESEDWLGYWGGLRLYGWAVPSWLHPF